MCCEGDGLFAKRKRNDDSRKRTEEHNQRPHKIDSRPRGCRHSSSQGINKGRSSFGSRCFDFAFAALQHRILSPAIVSLALIIVHLPDLRRPFDSYRLCAVALYPVPLDSRRSGYSCCDKSWFELAKVCIITSISSLRLLFAGHL